MSAETKKYLQEVNAALRPLSNKTRKGYDENYLKSQFENLGIRVPIQRKLGKAGFSFSHLPHEEQKKIWDYVWKHATTHEAMNQARYYFDKHFNTFSKADWRMFKSWIARLDNWAHSDYLSSIYSNLLELFPDLVYPTLKTWNKSSNSWKRRNSVVSLIYYASPKRKPPAVNKILPLVKTLIKDKDAYVQKGVGWTLRECGNIYPEQTWRFLKKHIKELAPTSYSYSTEKLSKTRKAELKKLRKL